MPRFPLLASVSLCLGTTTSFAQYVPPDSSALESIMVETYYVAEADDAADEDGSAQLVEGAVTYRVFVDMKPGYDLQIVGGFAGHPITFNTTTTFFNNEDRGEPWGDAINDIHLDKNTVAIDSWLSFGAASDAHWGVLKADDPDGAQDGVMFPNDGGSNGVAGGLLTNDVPLMGIPLTVADGLMTDTVAPPSSTFVGTAPEIFNTGGASYTDENFGLAVLGEVNCPTPGNRILIGQFTTDGVFSFCLNLWLKIPDSLVCDAPECLEAIEYYGVLLPSDTSESAGAQGNYRFSKAGLCWSSDQQAVDCLGVPGGPAVPGTACDDGNADTDNDVYDAGCSCVGEDCEGVLGGDALPGQPCDDGNANTGNDTWQAGCVCIGSVGIEEHSRAIVSVHPNPTRDLLRVRIDQLNGEVVSIELRNMLGSRVRHVDLGKLAGDRSEILDLSGLGAGSYMLVVHVGTDTHMERITRF